MTTAWHSEYLSALASRDKSEQQNKSLYEAYTALASRHSLTPTTTTTSSSTKHQTSSTPPPAQGHPPSQSPAVAPTSPSRVLPWSRAGSPPTSSTPASVSSSAPTAAQVARWQEELSEAQRRRAELEAGLGAARAELERERARLGIAERRVAELVGENGGLVVKLRDRVEECRVKGKMVQDVHDESVALNLQLNLSEERNALLKKENQELVDRWMARMGKEADAMNEASRF